MKEPALNGMSPQPRAGELRRWAGVRRAVFSAGTLSGWGSSRYGVGGSVGSGPGEVLRRAPQRVVVGGA